MLDIQYASIYFYTKFAVRNGQSTFYLTETCDNNNALPLVGVLVT